MLGKPGGLHRDAAALVVVLAAAAAHAAPRLGGQAADVSAITVSGLSSGGYMAVQFHVAHSASVKGAGIIAAGPYYCAEGSASAAYFNCMTPQAFAPLPPLSRLEAVTARLEKSRRIDATANLAGARIWLFSGTRDTTVLPEVVSALAGYYRHYVNAATLRFIRDLPAGHAIPSADRDITHACETTEMPYINRCIDKKSGAPYDAAGAMLAHLLGATPSAPAKATGSLASFDQREFAHGSAYSISLGDAGYVYVPEACRKERCRVHVAFHGCGQNAELVKSAFVREAGYNRWADAHRLIVLYPQTIARYGLGFDGSVVLNPYACWDWWGYTGADYHTKAAPQIRAVKAMVERLGERR
jgi:poly(3-hydroxybutyrate) depolymerase